MAALHHLVLPHRLLSGHGPPPVLRFSRRPRPLLHLLPCAAAAATRASAAATAVTAPSDAALQDFRRWLSSQGAETGSVAPAVVPEGLGLVAARDLPRGEVVAEVPKKLWSEEELLEIQGTQLLSTTMGVKEYVQSEFDNVEAEIINANKDLFPGTITFDDFLWAFGVLRSRVFPELRGDKLALIPFADLIYVQYDLDKSNAELALDYGFTEANSSRDSYTLTLEISESDPFYEDKLDIAELNGMGETAYFDVVLGESLPPQMITYLRLLCLGGTDAFLLEALFRNKVWEHLELPDEELLEREDLQSRQQIAIEVRVGEKKVLEQINDIFKEREQELDDLEYYQERRLKDLGFIGDNGDIIFWES
uniref:Rubisco LSMT substrate-binding domain-containing protein n=1 Tax=Aegilops tauschii TaxID=37682 RepID=M8BD03_AEGTA